MSKTLYFCVALIACCSFAGCAGVRNSMRLSEKNSQWNPLSQLTEDREKKKEIDKKFNQEAGKPVSMAVIWKDSVIAKPGTTPVKGFGGRVFFYDENSNAVKADGELIVYGFDDSDSTVKTDKAKADRKYVFKADQFQSHYSNSDLGASYSVWVPWEKDGGYRKQITLIPVFKTADGGLIKTGHSINVLPGRNPASSSAVRISSPGSRPSSQITQASFDASAGESGIAYADLEQEELFNRTSIKTTTIQLTPHLANQLSKPLDSSDRDEKSGPDAAATAATTETAAEASPKPRFSRQIREEPSSNNNGEGASQGSERPGSARPWVFGKPGVYK